MFFFYYMHCFIVKNNNTFLKARQSNTCHVRSIFPAARTYLGYNVPNPLVSQPMNFSICSCMLSHFSHVPLFVTLWTLACQAPLSVGFSRQEYWSGLPCSPPGHLAHPGIQLPFPTSPALLQDSLPLVPPGKPLIYISTMLL